jgi:hypothetical protein
MTKDDIVKLAIEHTINGLKFDEDGLVRFARLVAEHEREQCKKLCTWKTGNKFVDEAVAVCYRAIDQRAQA